MRENKLAVALAAALMFASVSPAVLAAADSAKAILDKVAKNVDAKDEVANVKMKITEADGSAKTRELEIRRKGKDDTQKVLVKLQGPADLKGTALLSVSKGTSSDQWLYLPASKQARRLQGGKSRGGSFMGSELSYEDMGTSSDAKYQSKVLGKKKDGGRDFTLIENTPKGESNYGKTIIWVDDKTNLVGKIEYFDKTNKPLKVSTFSDYKKFDNVFRAQKISVVNSQNKRGTVLELSGLKLNKGLDDGEFTESALTEGD
ncbi:MAG: outer membrane lipoprotein-sorting protein [Bdellovibrionota bacterium]